MMNSMSRLPSLFVSHGAPDFALKSGRAGPALNALGQALQRPEAILVISPHWMTAEPRVTARERPSTIHDFSGFDPALYDIEYPAVGHPVLAGRVVELLAQAGWTSAATDRERGLDHGAWVPLLHLYPKADIPVVQLSLPETLTGEQSFNYGRALSPLAEEGVLIIGSGSLTHNLRHVFQGTDNIQYALEFRQWIREAVEAGDSGRLREALTLAPHAREAHPTPEHYWPLVVAAGASGEGARARVIDGGMTYGVLAMDAFVFG